jgi:hypothetical protein
MTLFLMISSVISFFVYLYYSKKSKRIVSDTSIDNKKNETNIYLFGAKNSGKTTIKNLFLNTLHQITPGTAYSHKYNVNSNLTVEDTPGEDEQQQEKIDQLIKNGTNFDIAIVIIDITDIEKSLSILNFFILKLQKKEEGFKLGSHFLFLVNKIDEINNPNCGHPHCCMAIVKKISQILYLNNTNTTSSIDERLKLLIPSVNCIINIEPIINAINTLKPYIKDEIIFSTLFISLDDNNFDSPLGILRLLKRVESLKTDIK